MKNQLRFVTFNMFKTYENEMNPFSQLFFL